MATDLLTPSNQTAKMRWKEPYVSEGLNKKFNGVVPHGVVRGGRLGTSGLAMNITIEADPNTNDSIYSFIDSNGHQITFRQVANVTLDLTAVASTTIYIGLEITFTTSFDTVVKWRAFSLAEVQADPTLVVLGRVDVPASGLIPASDITPEERRSAWMSISPEAREWRQVVENGSFELCRDVAYVSGGDGWPGWDLVYASVAGVNLSVTDTEARSGRHSLLVNLTGVGTQRVYLYQGAKFNVYSGQLYRASVHVKGVALSAAPSSALGLRVAFYDESGGVSAQNIYDLSLFGTFDWTEIALVGEVPANSVLMEISVRFYDSGGATGDVYFDDVRLWLEQGESLDSFEQNNLCDGSLRSLTLDVVPPLSGIIDDDIRDSLRFRQNPAVGAVLQLLLGNRGGATEFLMQLERGGLTIDNLIESLGANKVGSNDDASLPRLKVPFRTGSKIYTLIGELDNGNASGAHIRLYACDSESFNSEVLVITVNARWDGSTGNWVRDVADDAIRYDFGTKAGFLGYSYDSSDPSPWPDDDWWLVGSSLFRIGHPDATYGVRSRFFGFLDSRGRTFLGNDLEGSAADIAVPRLECDVPAAATGKYTCIFTGDTGGQRIRLYASRDSVQATSDVSFALTINAEWDGTQWDRSTNDDPASDSSMYQFTRSHMYFFQRDAAKTDTWADSGWGVGSGWPSIDFEMGGSAGSEYGELDLHDGVVKFTGTLTSRTYPAANAYIANHLFAKSIVKGFCKFTTDGASGATIHDDASWNVDGISFNGNSVIMSFDVDFVSVDDYAVVVTLGQGTDYPVVTSSSDETEVWIAGFNYSTGIIDMSASVRDVFVVIFGTQ